MTHRFPVKEIARQSGLGTATIDRVLNNRAHVSPQTRARVQAALVELEAQEQQLAAKGRRLFVDLVVEAPARFSRQVQTACEGVLPSLPGAVFRPRFLFQERMSEADVVGHLVRIRARGSNGVILKARDVKTVRSEVERLVSKGIPVVTLVTDLPGSRRTAYVGVDNAQAGKSAAYLLTKELPDGPGTILTTRSQEDFQGEAKRFEHFKASIADSRPDLRIYEIVGSAGLTGETRQRLRVALASARDIAGIYSMGGGNKAILDVLRDDGVPRCPFVAHDLDRDNLELLRAAEIDYVLNHDLSADMERAFRVIAEHYGLLRQTDQPAFSDIQIVTPHNIPAKYEARPATVCASHMTKGGRAFCRLPPYLVLVQLS